LVALSWWERRRPRQAFAPRLRESSLGHGDAQRSASAEPSVAGEPWIGEAGLSDVVADEPVGEGGIHAHGEPSVRGPLEELPTLVIPDAEECRALEAAWIAQPPEPTLIDPEAAAAVESFPGPDSNIRISDVPATHEQAGKEPSWQEPSQSHAPAARSPVQPGAPSSRDDEIPGAEGVGPVRIVGQPRADRQERSATPNASAPDEPGDLPADTASGAAAIEASPPVEPIVEWPPEDSRRILSLRLVAPQAERFSGRTVRLALAAEGFLLGKFAIFHKPDEANRAVLSAAALTRPGAFDLDNMDSQRYGGLSLFAVLPGPKAPPQAFEELLSAARGLNERLEGALQDERGGPLTPMRVASIRDSLKAEAANSAAAAAHGG